MDGGVLSDWSSPQTSLRGPSFISINDHTLLIDSREKQRKVRWKMKVLIHF